MEAIEYPEIKLNTSLNNVGIHSSIPRWTIKTGTVREIPSVVVLGTPEQYHSAIAIDNTYPPLDNAIKDYFATLSLSSIRASAQEKKSRRYVEYISEFSKNWDSKKPHFNSFAKDFVWDKFKTTIDQLLQHKPDYISFNLTNDCSIFFKAIIKGKNVYLELFFDEEVEGNVEAIVNIYKDGKVVIAYGGSIEETFQKIQELFNSKDKITVSTSIPYAISSAYFATAEF
jgi:hypothetical protein